MSIVFSIHVVKEYVVSTAILKPDLCSTVAETVLTTMLCYSDPYGMQKSVRPDDQVTWQFAVSSLCWSHVN